MPILFQPTLFSMHLSFTSLGTVSLLKQIIDELGSFFEVTGAWKLAKELCFVLMSFFLIYLFITGNDRL